MEAAAEVRAFPAQGQNMAIAVASMAGAEAPASTATVAVMPPLEIAKPLGHRLDPPLLNQRRLH